MRSDTTDVADTARAIVAEYFLPSLNALHEWSAPLARQLTAARAGGTLTHAELDALVKPYAMRTFSLPGVPVFGCGFIAALNFLSDAPSHLSWWQGPQHEKLDLSSHPIDRANIDYSQLEWYRVPMSTGEPHVAGPYVDYLCSDEYTISIVVPVFVDDDPAGLAGMDARVTDIERDLVPHLEALGSPVTLTNTMGRVVASTDPILVAGEVIRDPRLVDLPRTHCPGISLDVIVDSP